MPKTEFAHIISIDLRKYDDNPSHKLCFYTTFQFCDGMRRIDLYLNIKEVDDMLQKLGLSRPSQLIGRHVDVILLHSGDTIVQNVR